MRAQKTKTLFSYALLCVLKLQPCVYQLARELQARQVGVGRFEWLKSACPACFVEGR